MSQLSQFIGGTGGDEIGSLPVLPKEFFQAGETYTALSGNTYLASGVLLESSTVANAASLPGITLEKQEILALGSATTTNIHYVNSLWLYSFNQTLYTSADGESWTNRGTHGGTGYQQLSADVLWTGTNYFILSTVTGQSTAGSISSDGVTWAAKGHAGGALTMNSVATNGSGVIVAVGAGSTANATSNALVYSTNHGVNFNTQSLATTTILEKVIYGNSLFVAVGGAGTQVIQTSATGAGGTWTNRSIPTASYRAIIWNGSKFVALGGSFYDSNGTTGAYSSDGVTWTASTVPSAVYRDIAWNGTIFVAVGANGANAGTTCATSTDGITWTSRTIPSGLYYRVQWTGTHFVAFCTVITTGNTYRIGAYSTDGITWKDITCTNSGASVVARSVYAAGKTVSMVGGSAPTVNVNDSSTFANFYTGVATAVSSVDSNTQLTRALRIS